LHQILSLRDFMICYFRKNGQSQQFHVNKWRKLAQSEASFFKSEVGAYGESWHLRENFA
jgi:hypothetical protein